MHSNNFLLVLVVFLSFNNLSYGIQQPEESRMKVAMRMIGHEIMLKVGDSTSRILPIQNYGKQYRIDFESEFAFEPQQIVGIVNEVVRDSKIKRDYIIEVKSCLTSEVVHSYQIGGQPQLDVVPCGARSLPKACYYIEFTMLAENYFKIDQNQLERKIRSEEKSNKNYRLAYLFIPILLFVGWGIYSKRKKEESPNGDTSIKLGKYTFDRNNMKLTLEREEIELTSKEAELLSVLYASVNETLKREEILNQVWGDEGDYVGRTLDVFISKLRKKLEADPNVKIANIRGVGYRLILDKS